MKGFSIYDIIFLSYFLIAGYIFYDLTFVVLTLTLLGIKVMAKSGKD
ncbi:MAG: hypothetical protein ACXAD7_01915 [Candidatus Kariarchaeaceae archaeon]